MQGLEEAREVQQEEGEELDQGKEEGVGWWLGVVVVVEEVEWV